MAVLSPQGALALIYSAHTLTLFCALFRVYIQRGRQHHTVIQTCTNVVLVVASLNEFIATSVITPTYVREIHWREKYDSAQVEKLLFYSGNLKDLYIAHFLYVISTCLVKACYTMFYFEIFNGASGKRKMALWAVTGYWLACYISVVLVILFSCRPIRENWNPLSTNKACPSEMNLRVFVAICTVNISSDVALLAIPFLVISTLQLKRAERLSLIAVFGVGIISIIFSISRLFYVYPKIVSGLSWNTLHIYTLMSHAEVFFGILAFTLPLLRPMVSGLFKRYGLFTSSVKMSNSRSLVAVGNQRRHQKPTAEFEMLEGSLFQDDISQVALAEREEDLIPKLPGKPRGTARTTELRGAAAEDW